MNRALTALLLTGCLLFSLSGCGAKEEAPPPPAASSVVEETVEPTPLPEPVPEPEPEPEPEPVYVPGGVNPLTGLPMEEEYENLRPVAVMINNHKASQPQLGISQADVIYEIPAEGEITRMLAVFQTLDGVETLGSIRSARPYYIEAALGHDAFYVHAGGSFDAYEALANWGVPHMDGVNGGRDAQIFWRDSDRKASLGYEHSLVTSGGKILEYLDSTNYRREHKDSYSYPVSFVEDGTPAGGTDATEVKVKFSNYKTGVFEYDAETGLYMSNQYGKAHVDGSTDEQVGVTNLLVLETAMSVIAGDSEGRLNVRMTGTGKGTFYCGGKGVEIQWSKADRSTPFSYSLADGTPLSLGQGKTYVCIITPKWSSVTAS